MLKPSSNAGQLNAGLAAGANGADALASALRTLAFERDGLDRLKERLENGLGAAFAAAVAAVRQTRGRVIVTGMGKSGHVGQKIAATLASTGTPAYFVHPSEASHGDLGMITRDDCVLALSWSGESVELTSIITYARRFRVALIAITSRSGSALGRAADVVLELPAAAEACPHGLAPTTSTVQQLAIGDCLAVALLESKGFSAHDFKVFHPGGSLGANLKLVSDVMHRDDNLPIVEASETMATALITMTAKSFGCLGVIDGEGRLAGVITDGDLRRHMGTELPARQASEIMTKNPKTIQPGMLASAALEVINASRITALFVVDDGKPVGIIHVHDLLRVGVA